MSDLNEKLIKVKNKIDEVASKSSDINKLIRSISKKLHNPSIYDMFYKMLSDILSIKPNIPCDDIEEMIDSFDINSLEDTIIQTVTKEFTYEEILEVSDLLNSEVLLRFLIDRNRQQKFFGNLAEQIFIIVDREVNLRIQGWMESGYISQQ
jgi:uncharacterized membrane-anchored protein YjiN (DUF445 family)